MSRNVGGAAEFDGPSESGGGMPDSAASGHDVADPGHIRGRPKCIAKLKTRDYYYHTLESSETEVYIGQLSSYNPQYGALHIMGGVVIIGKVHHLFVKAWPSDRPEDVEHFLVLKHGLFRAHGVVFEVQESDDVSDVHQADHDISQAVTGEIGTYIASAKDGCIVRLGHEFICRKSDARECMSVIDDLYREHTIISSGLSGAGASLCHVVRNADGLYIGSVSIYTKLLYDMSDGIIKSLKGIAMGGQDPGPLHVLDRSAGYLDLNIRKHLGETLIDRERYIESIRENVGKLDDVGEDTRALFPLDKYTVLAVGKLKALLDSFDLMRRISNDNELTQVAPRPPSVRRPQRFMNRMR